MILLGPSAAVQPDEAALAAIARELRAGGASVRDVARTLSAEHGAPRNLAYRLAQEAGE